MTNPDEPDPVVTTGVHCEYEIAVYTNNANFCADDTRLFLGDDMMEDIFSPEILVRGTETLADGSTKSVGESRGIAPLLHLEDPKLSPATLWQKNQKVEQTLTFTIYADEMLSRFSDDRFMGELREKLFKGEDSLEIPVKIRVAPRGDASLDGKVSVLDAYFALQIYVEGSLVYADPQLDPMVKTASDINRDGKVDGDDFWCIMEYYVRVLVSYEPISWDDIIQIAAKR